MHINQRPTLKPHKQWEVHRTINQQQQNHRLRTDGCLSHRVCVCVRGVGGEMHYWRQIFALDNVVVKNKTC